MRKIIYLNPPVDNQNDHVGAGGRKADVAAKRLLDEREKFAKHVMVSAEVYFSGKGKLYFVAEKVKVSVKHYFVILLPHLINDFKQFLPAHIIFQQDGTPANTAKLAEEWIEENRAVQNS